MEQAASQIQDSRDLFFSGAVAIREKVGNETLRSVAGILNPTKRNFAVPAKGRTSFPPLNKERDLR
jgi:hypothetical protein